MAKEQIHGSTSSPALLARALHKMALTIQDARIEVHSEELVLCRGVEMLRGLREKRKQMEDDLRSRESIASQVDHCCAKQVVVLPILRWKCAMRVLEMCNLELDFPTEPKGFRTEGADGSTIKWDTEKDSRGNHGSKKQQTYRYVSGCSSIFDLPLPNAWAPLKLKTCVPDKILCAALSHIAMILDTVASIMNFRLPYDLKPFEVFECAMIAPAFDVSRLLPLTPLIGMEYDEANREDELKGFQLSRNRQEKHDNGDYTIGGEGSKIDRKEEDMTQNAEIDSFVTAMLNLQFNVIYAATQMGVDPTDLWPQECILLNLGKIREKCRSVIIDNDNNASRETNEESDGESEEIENFDEEDDMIDFQIEMADLLAYEDGDEPHHQCDAAYKYHWYGRNNDNLGGLPNENSNLKGEMPPETIVHTEADPDINTDTSFQTGGDDELFDLSTWTNIDNGEKITNDWNVL